ncbi:histidine kinase [Spirochaeta isovalerica]|uniref:Sensor histidine kinase YesM n=1 Tax=Spirochaeta isovalerica TaxID=150 RepID=A0A841RF17_9SPIO|nr:sensor histidine kinase YesM [Spirochaeta isovalerica]
MIRFRISNSLRAKLLYYFLLSMVFTILSFGMIFAASLAVQDIADQRFADEQYLHELQGLLDEIQEPLETYLAIYSSSSLATLLYTTETLKDALPQSRPVSRDELELLKKEIYFLIDSYLLQVNQIIELKRGRKVQAYTDAFEEMSVLYNYITARINEVSLKGFRRQLGEYRNFLDLFRTVQMYSLILILLIMAFAYSLLMKNINTISTPVLQLSIMAGKISAGDFDVPDVNFHSVNEINHVAAAFNEMKNSISHYIDELKKQKDIEQEIMTERVRNLKMEQLLKRMELYTMQAQMNPHFLFNTLNTGVQLAIVEEAEKTADFMENLAALFRFNIREKKFFVPLRHEYEGLKSYFNILKIRFPNTLKLELDVEEELLDQFSCPAMMLQPIVENSVLHAFKNREGLGSIVLSIHYELPVLKISVKDDGIGIPEKTVQALLTPHTHDYQLSSKVMGLENVIQRCYFFYPDEKDVVQIISGPEEGTEIIININTEVEPCIEL